MTATEREREAILHAQAAGEIDPEVARQELRELDREDHYTSIEYLREFEEQRRWEAAQRAGHSDKNNEEK